MMDEEVIYYYSTEDEAQIVIQFEIESSSVLEIGEQINQINSEAYMNGYGWGAFIEYYFGKHHPELMKGMIVDPEAGCFFAEYDNSDENEEKAKSVVQIIQELLKDEKKLFAIIRKEGNLIPWE